MPTTYQLKATLRDIRPPIWRRILVPGDVTLATLHRILQIAFEWTNTHLHQFPTGRDTFGIPDPEHWGPPVINERKVRVEQVAAERSKVGYDYDFGDSWHHDILVERIDSTLQLDLKCIDGARACPPE